MDIKKEIDKLCKQSLLASNCAGKYDSKIKNAVLRSMSDNLDINFIVRYIVILNIKKTIMKGFDFQTKLTGYNVSVTNGVLDSSDMEGAFTIKWDFYTELREWGVKNIGVYATSIEGVVFKNDECVDDSERTVVNSEDKGWRITSDTSNIKQQVFQYIDHYIYRKLLKKHYE